MSRMCLGTQPDLVRAVGHDGTVLVLSASGHRRCAPGQTVSRCQSGYAMVVLSVLPLEKGEAVMRCGDAAHLPAWPGCSRRSMSWREVVADAKGGGKNVLG